MLSSGIVFDDEKTAGSFMSFHTASTPTLRKGGYRSAHQSRTSARR
jgi:hypothetical protein